MAGIIKKENLRAQVSVHTWQEAIRATGEILEQSGAITPEYTEAMIQAVQELGPYMVVAPGIAIAHAAPSKGVLRQELALLTLAKPVVFGSPKDPVKLILCMASESGEQHLEALGAVAALLSQDGMLGRLAAAESVEALEGLLDAGDE